MRNQMRSTKPRLVERRTAVLAQTGHSCIFLAKVSFMGLGSLQMRYQNYEEQAHGEARRKERTCALVIS
jgi:hypothetical protein